jgi:hypothetical protein
MDKFVGLNETYVQAMKNNIDAIICDPGVTPKTSQFTITTPAMLWATAFFQSRRK